MAEALPPVVILGAGGHARAVAEALGAHRVTGHLSHDDTSEPTAPVLGPRLGNDQAARELAAAGYVFAVGVGFVDRRSALRRADLLDRLDGPAFITVRHPSASVSPSAVLGPGTFVGPGAVVGVGARLGRAVIVNSGAVVDHDCSIGNNVHIGPGAALSGGVHVGDHTMIGIGAAVLQGLRIGSEVMVGAGAAVIDELHDGVTAVGVPARAALMTNFLVIGFGSIGRRHADNLAMLYPGARFTILRHRGGVDDPCRRLGARVVTDLLDVVDESFDLAILATPSANHIELLPTLIEQGWPLLVEKPIVAHVADCDRIDAALLAADPVVRVAGFNLRYLPSIRRMKAAIDAGDLGHIVRASFTAGQWLPDWRPDADYRTSYSADAARGGGVELDLAHEFDMARWLLAEKLEVDFARCGKFSDLELRSNDTSVSVLSPEDTPDPVVVVALDYVARRRVRRYEVVGDRGRIEWDIDGELRMETAAGRCSLVTGPDSHDVGMSYVTMMQNVMRAIQSEDDGCVQRLDDGLASTRLALAVRERGGVS